MTEEDIKKIQDEIRVTVNGKIDASRKENMEQFSVIQDQILSHNSQHEKDMVRILPVLEAFEQKQRDLDVAERAGKRIFKVLGFITALGGAWLVIKQIFNI